MTKGIPPRGTCSECKKTIALRNDGTLRGHGWDYMFWCPGSWLHPLETQTSAPMLILAGLPGRACGHQSFVEGCGWCEEMA
jgi:hypothetical protein